MSDSISIPNFVMIEQETAEFEGSPSPLPSHLNVFKIAHTENGSETIAGSNPTSSLLQERNRFENSNKKNEEEKIINELFVLKSRQAYKREQIKKIIILKTDKTKC